MEERKVLNAGESFFYNSLQIGGAADVLCCTKSILRYYEDEFKLNIPRTPGGRRSYGEKEIDAFRYIFTLKKQNYSNSQIKKVLFTRGKDDCLLFDGVHKPENDENLSINELKEMIIELRDEIIHMKEHSDVKDKNELIEENLLLKDKLKQKTYELVEARDKLSKLKSKKIFK